MLASRRSRVARLGLWSTALYTTSPASAKQTGTTCGRASSPAVPRWPTRAEPTRCRIACASIASACPTKVGNMRIGIGLPNTLPETTGTRLLDWARRAEERGFAGLATLDRVVFPSYDPLSALAAVAGATSRIGLMTNVLLAPVHPPVLLAKTSAGVDQISAGRLTLGLAPGGRPDDFAAVG